MSTPATVQKRLPASLWGRLEVLADAAALPDVVTYLNAHFAPIWLAHASAIAESRDQPAPGASAKPETAAARVKRLDAEWERRLLPYRARWPAGKMGADEESENRRRDDWLALQRAEADLLSADDYATTHPKWPAPDELPLVPEYYRRQTLAEAHALSDVDDREYAAMSEAEQARVDALARTPPA